MSIEQQARFRLATLPTPIVEAIKLREALGGKDACPRILIKRDDLTGLAFGGNKARKLEFLVADALRAGATVLVTSGAAQSNHARMTAAAARVAGMRAALILTREVNPSPPQGNLLLDYLLGAEVHYMEPSLDPLVGMGDQEAVRIAEVVEDLKRRGEHPYVIPVGGSSAVGALGYVAGTLELLGQLYDLGESPTTLYYASGSRGSQAGLTVGSAIYRAPYRLVGVAVSGSEPEKTLRAKRISNEVAAMLSVSLDLQSDDFITEHDYIGSGYGIPTPACLEAITLVAQTEAIFLDPVYTAKAMAGMIDHIRRRLISPTETVMFLHTGGTPALFAHANDFAFDVG